MASGQRRFAVMGDNLFNITNKLTSNQRLCRLLKYSTKDPFSVDYPDINGDELLNKEILLIPKIPDNDNFETSFIITSFQSFKVNPENAEFKVSVIRFDIVCPQSCWILNEGSLRPYLIMQEIDETFNEAKIAGLGNLKFLQSDQLTLSPQLAGYSMYYTANEFN